MIIIGQVLECGIDHQRPSSKVYLRLVGEDREDSDERFYLKDPTMVNSLFQGDIVRLVQREDDLLWEFSMEPTVKDPPEPAILDPLPTRRNLLIE